VVRSGLAAKEPDSNLVSCALPYNFECISFEKRRFSSQASFLSLYSVFRSVL
jgi:hypothetical protein